MAIRCKCGFKIVYEGALLEAWRHVDGPDKDGIFCLQDDGRTYATPAGWGEIVQRICLLVIILLILIPLAGCVEIRELFATRKIEPNAQH